MTRQEANAAIQMIEGATSDLVIAWYWCFVSSLEFDDYWDYVCFMELYNLEKKIDKRFEVERVLSTFAETGSYINPFSISDPMKDFLSLADYYKNAMDSLFGINMAVKPKNEFINITQQS